MKKWFTYAAGTAIALCGTAAFAQEPDSVSGSGLSCDRVVITGHPEYAPIAYRDGDRIVGAAPTVVEDILRFLGLPVESRYTGSWADAQLAAREGQVDIIFGIYYNDERAEYLEYVQPPMLLDPVVAVTAEAGVFSFAGRQDLVGKRGITNEGESYGDEFDAFMAANLAVARSAGVDAGFATLLSGGADYLLIGLYPGLAEASRLGVKDRVVALEPALLAEGMYVAFSKRSPCQHLIPAVAAALEALQLAGRIDAALGEATQIWDARYASPAEASVAQ